jgi:hypothetical protein
MIPALRGRHIGIKTNHIIRATALEQQEGKHAKAASQSLVARTGPLLAQTSSSKERNKETKGAVLTLVFPLTRSTFSSIGKGTRLTYRRTCFHPAGSPPSDDPPTPSIRTHITPESPQWGHAGPLPHGSHQQSLSCKVVLLPNGDSRGTLLTSPRGAPPHSSHPASSRELLRAVSKPSGYRLRSLTTFAATSCSSDHPKTLPTSTRHHGTSPNSNRSAS